MTMPEQGVADNPRRMVAFLIALGVFGADRWTKWLVETQLSAEDSKTVIPGFFSIVRSENPGVAFGMFSENTSQSHTFILASFSLIAVLLLAAMLWRIDKLDTPSAAGLALIFGGAMGNVFDRLHAGRVTDFLDFAFGSYHWYTFNLADTAICTGACLLVVSMLFRSSARSGPDMLPHLVKLGSFAIPTYGVLVALAFLTALLLATRFAKERGINTEKVVNLGVYCALTGMLGAKIMMIALDPDYRAHPLEIFSLATLQSAGIFFGGLILAVVFAYFYMRAQQMPVLGTCDIFAPGLAIGHGIGRLGCFAAGCCWGKPTRLPWAVTFTSPDTTTGVPLNIPLHPTQLYEALAEGMICLVLIWQLRKPHGEGRVIGLYSLLYGAVRFGVEFLRDHDASNPFGGPFTLEQWISLALVVTGMYLVTRSVTNTASTVPA